MSYGKTVTRLDNTLFVVEPSSSFRPTDTRRKEIQGLLERAYPSRCAPGGPSWEVGNIVIPERRLWGVEEWLLSGRFGEKRLIMVASDESDRLGCQLEASVILKLGIVIRIKGVEFNYVACKEEDNLFCLPASLVAIHNPFAKKNRLGILDELDFTLPKAFLFDEEVPVRSWIPKSSVLLGEEMIHRYLTWRTRYRREFGLWAVYHHLRNLLSLPAYRKAA